VIRLTSKLLSELRAAYTTHRSNSVTRDIPFLMTFSEWLMVWMESGHLHERGRRRGQYCMARTGDRGPYAVGNVVIMLHALNATQGHIGKKVSKATRARISRAKRGKPKSAEHRLKLSLALKGRTLSPEHCAKISASNKAAWTGRRLAYRVEARL
jgi:hypothetical protein